MSAAHLAVPSLLTRPEGISTSVSSSFYSSAVSVSPTPPQEALPQPPVSQGYTSSIRDKTSFVALLSLSYDVTVHQAWSTVSPGVTPPWPLRDILWHLALDHIVQMRCRHCFSSVPSELCFTGWEKSYLNKLCEAGIQSRKQLQLQLPTGQSSV